MPRGKKVFSKILAPVNNTDGVPQQIPTGVRDVILHALLARVALKDNNNVEFETVLDQEANEVEINFPDEILPVFDEILGMKRGPRFQAYIDWLIGRQAIIDDVPSVGATLDTDVNFVSATGLTFWGATVGNLDNEKVVLFLPTNCTSILGYNAKLSPDFDGSDLRVSLIWIYEGGSNTSFDIRASVNVGEIGGSSVATVSNDTNISTFNLMKGDIRETVLVNVNGVAADDMINILISRIYDGSPDPKTDLVGVLGIKVEPI